MIMAKRISRHALDVQRAQTKIEIMILDAASEAGLTNIELLQALASSQQGILKYMLRAERHPDEPDKPAMEE